MCVFIALSIFSSLIFERNFCILLGLYYSLLNRSPVSSSLLEGWLYWSIVFTISFFVPNFPPRFFWRQVLCIRREGVTVSGMHKCGLPVLPVLFCDKKLRKFSEQWFMLQYMQKMLLVLWHIRDSSPVTHS